VLAAEHLLDFAGFHEPRELLDAVGQLAGDLFALPGPFDQDRQVVGAAAQRVDQLDLLFDAAPALQGLLRLDLVLPEVGSRRAGFYLGELFGRLRGVKDSS
jgi:hypothetical protein